MYNQNIKTCSDCTHCEGCQQMPNEVGNIPLFCMNCPTDNAACLKICSQNAFEVLGGAITLNREKCNKCMECIDVCPIGAIHIE